jgi:orotate phosphoribosyltransferase
VSATDSGSAIGAAAARLLLAGGAVEVSRERPYGLASGWASPVYVDCRKLLDDPTRRRAMTALALAAIRERWGAAPPFDAVAGAETAGIPWAALLAEHLDCRLRYVRKRPLGIGRNAQVEGGFVDGMRVLLVDDLATDANSKVAFTRGLRAAGAIVTDALVLFAHRIFPGTAERLSRLGLALHSLADWTDILSAPEAAALAPSDHAAIAAFLDDPVAWSKAHGGRMAL